MVERKRNVILSVLFHPENIRGDKWALTGLIAGIAFFCLPLFLHPHNTTAEVDWNQVASVHLVLRRALLQYRQIPLWTPFFGGGYPLWAYPENDFLNPFFLALLPLNLWLSLKIRILIYYLIGATGMYFLARRFFHLNLAGAFLAASLFTFQSYLPFHSATGNLYMGTYYYLPWIFYLFVKIPEGKKYFLASLLILAHLFIGATGLWMLCILLFLFLFSCLQSIQKRPRFVHLKNFGVIITLVALLAAVRLLPLADLLRHTERAFADYREAARGSLSTGGLLHSLLSPGPFLPGDSSGLGRDEPLSDSTIYLGIIPLLLALWSLVFARRKYLTFILLLIVFSLFTMGSGSPLDLFRILWRLPLFRSLHFPNKYFSPFIPFILSLAAGEFLLFPRPLPRKWWFKLCVLTLALGAIVHLFFINLRYQQHIFLQPPRPEKPAPQFFQALTFWEITPLPEAIADRRIPFYRPGNLTGSYASLRRLKMDRGEGLRSYPVLLQRYEAAQYLLAEKNIGKIYWYSWLYLTEMARPKYFIKLGRVDPTREPPRFYPEAERLFRNPGWRGKAYLELSRKPVSIDHFSPSSLSLTGETLQADTLIVNQNFYPGWKSGEGKIINCAGLLGIRLPRPGRRTVRLFYRPPSFYRGAIISVLTLVGIIIWAFLFKRGRFI